MKKLAVLFPGQGAQYIGMGNVLYQDFKVAREVFDEMNDVLNFDLKSIIFKGDMTELTLSENAQPAVVATSYALFKVYMQEIGIKPDYAAGHSLGELSALIAAGAVSFREGIIFAKKRGALMHRACTRKLGNVGLIMGITEKEVQLLLEQVREETGYITITGYNSPFQFLVAGENAAVKVLKNKVYQAGGEFTPFRMLPMKADAPFHSELMDFLLDDFHDILSRYKYNSPQWEVISSVTGHPYTKSEDIKENLAIQLIKPVKWRQTLSYLSEKKIDLALDIGPQYVLKDLMRDNNSIVQALSFDVEADLVTLENKLLYN